MMYKSMYKSELARLAGVSLTTFKRWLKSDKEELEKLGYKRTSHILSGNIVKYICEKYVIDIDYDKKNH